MFATAVPVAAVCPSRTQLVVRSVRENSLQRMSEKLGYGPHMDAQPKRVVGKATLVHPGCLWQAKGDRCMELVPSVLGAPKAPRQVSHITPFKQQPVHQQSFQRELLTV